MDEHILDSSAAVAFTRRESGWEMVAKVQHRLISSVNLAETASVLTEKGFTIHEAVRSLAILNLHVIDFDEAQAMEAARLRPLTRAYGLSLGDRACLALAASRGLPVLTTDRVWSAAAPHLTITLIR